MWLLCIIILCFTFEGFQSAPLVKVVIPLDGYYSHAHVLLPTQVWLFSLPVGEVVARFAGLGPRRHVVGALRGPALHVSYAAHLEVGLDPRSEVHGLPGCSGPRPKHGRHEEVVPPGRGPTLGLGRGPLVVVLAAAAAATAASAAAAAAAAAVLVLHVGLARADADLGHAAAAAAGGAAVPHAAVEEEARRAKRRRLAVAVLAVRAQLGAEAQRPVEPRDPVQGLAERRRAGAYYQGAQLGDGPDEWLGEEDWGTQDQCQL